MKVICATCKRVLQECKPGTDGDDRISHSSCFECAALSYGEYDFIHEAIMDGLG
jgi:hypothetical protein